jgi:outer membrane protein
MTYKSLHAGIVAVMCAIVPMSALAAGPATPAPKILVIDRGAVLRASKAGGDIARQVKAYATQAEADLKGQGQALRAQGEALRQQVAIMAPAVKAQKIKDFEAKQANLQKLVQTKQDLIQGGFYKARQQVEQALGPILQGIMAERGANMLLDRNAVVLGTVDVDITLVAVQRLNQKLPTVKVELTPLPPGVAAQMQAAQQQQQ